MPYIAVYLVRACIFRIFLFPIFVVGQRLVLYVDLILYYYVLALLSVSGWICPFCLMGFCWSFVIFDIGVRTICIHSSGDKLLKGQNTNPDYLLVLVG